MHNVCLIPRAGVKRATALTSISATAQRVRIPDLHSAGFGLSRLKSCSWRALESIKWCKHICETNIFRAENNTLCGSKPLGRVHTTEGNF
jgi:hypothetical protein